MKAKQSRIERIDELICRLKEIKPEIKKLIEWTQCSDVRELENRIHFLRYDREKAKGHDQLYSDYNQRVMSFEWTRSCVAELERERDVINIKLNDLNYSH